MNSKNKAKGAECETSANSEAAAVGQRIAQPFSDMARSLLCVALSNGNFASGKQAHEM